MSTMTTSDKQELEVIEELLHRGIYGKQYDPSWMRPKTLTGGEKKEALRQAYLRVNKLLEQ